MSEAKRKGKNFICLIKHEDGTYSGLEQIYHPTPSGCDRWVDGLEDSRKWKTKKEAMENIKNSLRALTRDKNTPGWLKWRLVDTLELI